MYKLYYYNPENIHEVGFILINEYESYTLCLIKINSDQVDNYRIEFCENGLYTIIEEK